MVLYLLRGAFILLSACVTMLYVLPFQAEEQLQFAQVLLMLGSTLGVAIAIIAVDVFTRHKKLSSMSGIFLGLIAGLLVAFAFSFVVDLYGVITAPKINVEKPQFTLDQIHLWPADGKSQKMLAQWNTYHSQLADKESYLKLLEGLKVLIGLTTCYLSMSLVMQTKDDFRFVIPYVEFAKEIRGSKPTLLDTSVIIDGRILDILETKTIQTPLIVPHFVLNELQDVADSSNKLKRIRGRRGLDILQSLQKCPSADIAMDDRDAPGQGVDQKLVAMALETDARIMTNDYNLNKIASLRGVDVININDLAKALRPVVLPGEIFNIKIIKPGESNQQGVGFMDDGTMVVVESARDQIGKNMDLVVTSNLQTSAGRMVFGRKATEADHQALPRRTSYQPATPA